MSDSIKSVGGLVAAISGVGAAVIASGTQAEKAADQVAAATGLTEDALKEVQEVSQNVYKDNFGGSMEDAANAVAVTYQQTKLMGDELQKATENAMLLEDTFGYDVEIRPKRILCRPHGHDVGRMSQRNRYLQTNQRRPPGIKPAGKP